MPKQNVLTKSITFKNGYKYQLVDSYAHKLPEWMCLPVTHRFFDITIYEDSNFWLVAKPGYAWDGCSGPTKDDKTNMRAGLVHDIFYQLLREKWLPPVISGYDVRKWADGQLYTICVADGMPKWRATYYYWAVRRFGDIAAYNPKKLCSAP